MRRAAPASSGNVGDVSFGTPSSAGPVTSYAATIGAPWSMASATLDWPGGTTAYCTVPRRLSSASGGAKRPGAQTEGWYPWWSGTIMLR